MHPPPHTRTSGSTLTLYVDQLAVEHNLIILEVLRCGGHLSAVMEEEKNVKKKHCVNV